MCQSRESVLNKKYSYIQEFFRLYNGLIKFLADVMLNSSPEEDSFIVSFSKLPKGQRWGVWSDFVLS